jgi:hypothetical protein
MYGSAMAQHLVPLGTLARQREWNKRVVEGLQVLVPL